MCIDNLIYMHIIMHAGYVLYIFLYRINNKVKVLLGYIPN